MPKFILELSRTPSDASWWLSCSITGEHKGFSGLQRSLTTELEMTKALEGAGISAKRSELAVGQARNDARASFEVSQNEAQKLSILHTDTSE